MGQLLGRHHGLTLVTPTSAPTPGCLGPGPAAPSLKPVGCLGPHTPPPHPCMSLAPTPDPVCLEKPNPGYLPAARPGSAHQDTGFSAQPSLRGGHLLSDNAVPSAVPSARRVSAGGWPPSTARLTCLLVAVCGTPPPGCSPMGAWLGLTLLVAVPTLPRHWAMRVC